MKNKKKTKEPKFHKVAKKVVPRKTYKKIKKHDNKKEKIDLYKYSTMSNLDMRLHYLEKRINQHHEKNKEAFHLFAKIKLLKMKMKFLYITFDKKDLNIVLKTMKEIEKELNRLKTKK